MKLFTKTFGCQMNFADSDEMFEPFRKHGFTATTSQEEADAVLVNTCTVRDLAEHKAASYLGLLKEWKQNRPDRSIVVTGCAAERAKKYFQHKFPHIDLIVGAKDIETFPKELSDYFVSKQIEETELVPNDLRLPSPAESSAVSQYVTIMRGCNYNCTYCIVPAVRGREKYIPIETILKNTRDKVAHGAKEIWLLGQTVNSYQPPNPPKPDYDFADLLRDVDQVEGLERLRFISPHPYYLSEKLMRAMAECGTVCEHMHLPVQSGSSKMLQKMKRNYTRESYLKKIQLFRTHIPNISITTDFIVGFPGETEEDFQATLSLYEEAEFDSAYCFKYSPRPGTPSANMEDDVPQNVKEKRLARLMELMEARAHKKAQSFVGQHQEVLVEERKDTDHVRGKNRHGWRVRVNTPKAQVGELMRVEIVGNHQRELKGVG